MITIEIFWNDLTKTKQNEILAKLGDNGNYDVIPIATIEFEENNNGGDSNGSNNHLP